MKKLLAVCVGLVVILGITSGILWRDLRAERQLASEQKARMTQAKLSDLGSARPQAPPAVNEAITTPVVSEKVPDPMPVSRADQRVPVSLPVPVSPAAMRLEEIRRGQVPQQAAADEAATAKVLQWRDRLLVAGQALTTEQLQALNAAAIREGRRDAEEALALQNPVSPTDREAVFRRREENLNRAHEVNLRILRTVGPQLTEEQAKALRAQFEGGHQMRLASLRAEEERAKLSAR
jgi:hypothetical protein